MRVIPNCALGRYGSDSNCAFDRRPPNCNNCGWDKFEIGRRKELLKEGRLTPVKPETVDYLRRQYGIRADLELRGLRV